MVAPCQSMDWGGANGFRAGAVTRLDLSVQRRLWPGTLSEGAPSFLFGWLETNLIHIAKDRGERDG